MVGLLVLLMPISLYSQSFVFETSIADTGQVFTELHTFDVDKNGHIYAIDYDYSIDSYFIKHFDQEYQFVEDIYFQDENGKPFYIFLEQFKVGPDNQFFVNQGEGGLIYFSIDGKYLGRVGSGPLDTIPLGYSTDIAFDTQNNLYVLSDIYLFIYDRNLNFKTRFQMDNLTGITSFALDTASNIYTYNSRNDTISKYSKEGKKLLSFSDPTLSNVFTFSPDINVDYSGNIWVPNPDYGYFQKYRDTSGFIEYFYGGVSYFDFPEQVIFKNGKMYILDLSNGEQVAQRVTGIYDRILIYNYIPQLEYKILGKKRIPLDVRVSYKVAPNINGFNYYWDFDGDNLLQVFNPRSENGSEGAVTSFLATDETTQGTLTCYIYDQNFKLVDSAKIEIAPVKKDFPYDIPETVCGEEVTDCSSGSINYVELNNLSNSTLCSPSGYSDYTADTVIAEVNLGEFYSLSIQISGDTTENLYAGVWIDLNNDGDFEDSDEFVGTAIAFDGFVKFANIQIPPSLNRVGMARLRIRARPLEPFTFNESCMRVADIGETEDYSLNISESHSLAASEVVTPNNDGKNDYFVIRGINADYSNFLVIIDGLGRKIKEFKNYQNDWPGSSDPKALPKGTYYYQFKNGPNSINGFFVVNK